MFLGIQLGYATIRTLTDTYVRNCVGDIRALRPTAIVGVPAVWELIRKGILAKVKASGPVSSTIFNVALSIKRLAGNDSIIGNVLDSLVFKTVKEATGGRLSWGVNGGAPLSLDTQEFLSLTLAPIIAGYGMTETTAFVFLVLSDSRANPELSQTLCGPFARVFPVWSRRRSRSFVRDQARRFR